MTDKYDKTCLQYMVAEILKKEFNFNFPNMLHKELSNLQVSNKENEAVQKSWISHHIYNMRRCSATIKVRTTERFIDKMIEIPSIIHKLCCYLLSQLHTVGLFRVSGSHKRIAVLKEHLQNDHQLRNENPHDVANIICQIFRQFSIRLIPKCLNSLLEQAAQADYCTKLMTLQLCCLLLPTVHLNTLMYTLKFFNTVSLYESYNKMNSSSLAAILVPNLFDCGFVELDGSRNVLQKQQDLLQILIDNYHTVGVVPPSLDKIVCTQGNCRHKEKISALLSCQESSDQCKNALDMRKSTRQSRRSINLKKLKSTPFKEKGRKRKSNAGDESSNPVKRRSLQGINDLVCSYPFKDGPPKLDFTSGKQKNIRQEACDLENTKLIKEVEGTQQTHDMQFTSAISKPKPFSSQNKENLMGKIKIDDSRKKRSSILKRFTSFVNTPVMKRRAMRKRRERAKQIKEIEMTQSSQVLTKDVSTISSSQPIIINDSITIFELSNSSMDENNEKELLPPPSPIYPSASQMNLARVEESFGCSLDNLATSKENIAASTKLASSSFDALLEADSIEILDSSQKEEGFYETKLNADLSLLSEMNPCCSKQQSPRTDNASSSTHSLPSIDSNQQLLHQFCTDRSNVNVGKELHSDHIAPHMSDLNESERYDTYLNSISYISSFRKRLKLPVKPEPPVRTCSKLTNKYASQSNETSSRKSTCRFPEEKPNEFRFSASQHDYFCKKIDFPTTITESSVTARNKLAPNNATKKTTKEKGISCIKPGKVSETIQHFNNLNHFPSLNDSIKKKLSPLPFKDVGSRKGSFKMGKPSGQCLKLDLPTSLQLLPLSSSLEQINDEQQEVFEDKYKIPHEHFTKFVDSYNDSDCIRRPFELRRRRSKSLDSLTGETKDFNQKILVRSPSLHTFRPSKRHDYSPVYFDFLNSSMVKRATPKFPRSRSPLMPKQTSTFL